MGTCYSEKNKSIYFNQITKKDKFANIFEKNKNKIDSFLKNFKNHDDIVSFLTSEHCNLLLVCKLYTIKAIINKLSISKKSCFEIANQMQRNLEIYKIKFSEYSNENLVRSIVNKKNQYIKDPLASLVSLKLQKFTNSDFSNTFLEIITETYQIIMDQRNNKSKKYCALLEKIKKGDEIKCDEPDWWISSPNSFYNTNNNVLDHLISNFIDLQGKINFELEIQKKADYENKFFLPLNFKRRIIKRPSKIYRSEMEIICETEINELNEFINKENLFHRSWNN